jgi:hypothetical protein
VASFANNSHGISSGNGVTRLRVFGTLAVGVNGADDCSTEAPDGNLIQGDTSCARSGVMDPATVTVTDSHRSSTFAGTANDAGNEHNALLLAGAPIDAGQIYDWTGFSSPFRAWGRGAETDQLHANNRSQCSGNCDVWDWRLIDVAIPPRFANGELISGAACPLPAGTGFPDHAGTNFVVHAIEQLRDGIGNDNGRCEMNEGCLFTPNLGAYQGEGSTATCVHSSGVNGVTMSGYTTNGAPH